MKFKVGDKVRIRQFDEVAKKYPKDKDGNIVIISGDRWPWVGRYFTASDKKYSGMEATITGISVVGPECYFLDIDHGLGQWSDETVEAI